MIAKNFEINIKPATFDFINQKPSIYMEKDNHTANGQLQGDVREYDKVYDSLVQISKAYASEKPLRQPEKSGLSPSAQITGLCTLGINLGNVVSIDKLISVENQELGTYEKAVIEMQVLYGLRISQVLQIKHSDITQLGAIMIKGSKGSMDRLCYPMIYKNFWVNFGTNRVMLSRGYNRFYFYRLYKKKGLFDVLGSNSNTSVTHILRYRYILSLLQSGLSIDEIRQLVGHKSINSTIHYVNNIAETKRS